MEKELQLAMLENMIELVKYNCTHHNCDECPFCYEDRQCAPMVLTNADDPPCDW